jgi:hypothetical protein
MMKQFGDGIATLYEIVLACCWVFPLEYWGISYTM